MKRNLTNLTQKTAQGFTGTTPDDLHKEEEILRSLEQLPGSNVSTVIDAPATPVAAASATVASATLAPVTPLAQEELTAPSQERDPIRDSAQIDQAVTDLTKSLNARKERKQQRLVSPASQNQYGPGGFGDMSLYGGEPS